MRQFEPSSDYSGLVKITEVIKKYKITLRTIRYYEETGLISSVRTSDYAYRMYDDAAIARLEKILLLRKLDISVKDIRLILNSSSSDELIKSLTNRKSQLEAQLSHVKKTKDRIMSFINQTKNSHVKTDVILSRCAPKSTKNVNLSEMKFTGSNEGAHDVPSENIFLMKKDRLLVSGNNTRAVTPEKYQVPLMIETTAKTDDTNLRLYFGEYYLFFNWECIDGELVLGDPVSGSITHVADIGRIKKDTFVNVKWVIRRDYMEIYVNDNRIYNIEYSNNYDFLKAAEIGVGSAEGSTVTLKALSLHKDGSKSDIDIATMKRKKSESYMENGELVINCMSDREALETREQFTLPLKIDLVAKTDSTNMRIYYNEGEIILNWERDMQQLGINDVIAGYVPPQESGGYITENEYHDISWIIHESFMALVIDREIQFYSEDYPYIKYLKKAGERISSRVKIASAFGSTVTVKSLSVSEL